MHHQLSMALPDNNSNAVQLKGFVRHGHSRDVATLGIGLGLGLGARCTVHGACVPNRVTQSQTCHQNSIVSLSLSLSLSPNALQCSMSHWRTSPPPALNKQTPFTHKHTHTYIHTIPHSTATFGDTFRHWAKLIYICSTVLLLLLTDHQRLWGDQSGQTCLIVCPFFVLFCFVSFYH